ncbi:hypothetical protein ASG67_09460 [Sphingomonas sp. Leaf339]|uniref:hypothetical protein n=1 Tax=Sphingomonas sp. Leaf339 TaxID=1736343 RepID=UPI0007015516|nr:hypothetical protein [Sphingomonas sp. Leaf339]KQU53061.1 hypothetical protein ASG67_09460 [Sphingomonas sp. Leaf339]
MKALFLIAAPFAAVLFAATPATAQSVFDGTWKADTSTAQFGGKPMVRTLKSGKYSCVSCPEPWTIAADGAFHPIKGDPYTDDVSVTVIDPMTVKFSYRKAGKVNGDEIWTVSPDKTMVTMKGEDSSAGNGTPVTYETQQTRLAPAAADAHAISGSWRGKSGGTVSDSGLMVTMKTEGDNLTMTYPTGESVTARFGGPAMAMANDPGKSMVKFARNGPSSFVSTMMRDGKVVSVTTVTVKPDGRTLTYSNESKRTGSTAQFTATKQ